MGYYILNGLKGKELKAFSIKLFCAYNENEPLVKGTEIWLTGFTQHNFS